MRKISSLGILLSLTLLLAGCGGGGGSATVGTTNGGVNGSNNNNGNSPATVSVLPASASFSVRVSRNLPGTSPVAVEGGPSWWNPLRWISSPALAQVLYTLPGARVDALGITFAIADAQGVARFVYLPPRPYRFVVSGADPALILQTLLVAGSGENLTDRIDEFTTMGSLLASQAADSLGTDTGGGDINALTAQFENPTITEFSAVRDLVYDKLGGSQPWLDLERFLPLDEDLRLALEAANQAATYKIQQVPFEKPTIGYPASPVLLTATFNRPLDPTTLAPLQGGGWSLSAPFGTVDAGNLASHGEVGYATQLQSVDGRAILPNTLYFRLNPSAVPAGTAQEYTLSLSSLPRDLQGHDVLSSRPAGSFLKWSFVSSGTEVPGAQITSNVTGRLDFQAAACHGSTNADLSQLAAPSLLLAGTRPDQFNFQYQTVPQPFTPPTTERVFELEVTDPGSTLQEGDTFEVSSLEGSPVTKLYYEERDYLANNDRNLRAFVATEGTVTVDSIEGSTIRFLVDGIFTAAPSPNSPGSPVGAQGSFCLRAEVEATFP